MKRIPTIKAVMTPFPWSIGPDAGLDEAERMMREHGIHHLPVIADRTLLGVLTSRDLRAAEHREREECRRLRTGDLTTQQPPPIVGLDVGLDNVLLRMASQRLDCVLVEREGKLVGIFTVTDACQRFAELLRSELPVGGDDAA